MSILISLLVLALVIWIVFWRIGPETLTGPGGERLLYEAAVAIWGLTC